MLRAAVGWNPVKENRAQTGIKNTAFMIVAKCGGKTVGMARVISDGGYVAYIADVIVHPEFQGHGIGRAMMERIVEYIDSQLEEDHFIFTSLHAAKDKEGFYAKFGFVIRPNEEHGAGMSRRRYFGDTKEMTK